MTEFVHDNLKYEIDEWGNVRTLSIYYEKENKKYIVTMGVCDFLVSKPHIYLEITRRSKNPLKNIFGDKVLAYSNTPLDIYTSSVWKKIYNDEITYPQDERYRDFLKMALNDIKKQGPKIKEDIKLTVEERKESEAKYKARRKQKEDEAQAKLRKKSKASDIELINAITKERK